MDLKLLLLVIVVALAVMAGSYAAAKYAIVK